MPDYWEDSNGNLIVDLGAADRKSEAIKGRAKLSEYSGVDLASGFKPSEIWTTRDGRKIAIPNLTDSHLLNIIGFLHGRVKRYKKEIAAKFLMRATGFSMMFDHIPDDVMEKHAEDTLKQIRKMEEEPDDVFLRRIFPIYTKLREECYRRKLLLPKEAVAAPPKEPKVSKSKPKKPERIPTLIEQMEELRKVCDECEGCEVHKSQWEIAEHIIAKYPGYSLGSPRGPDKAWKRLYPPES